MYTKEKFEVEVYAGKVWMGRSLDGMELLDGMLAVGHPGMAIP